MDPCFSRASSLDIVKKDLKKKNWSSHLFYLFFKRENKVKNKTLVLLLI